MNRRWMADMVIRWGLGLQVVFLIFLDWGTIAFLLKRSGTLSSWYLLGLGVLNVALVAATVCLWNWMRVCQATERSRLPRAYSMGSSGAGQRSR
jgi:hypothetical protein